MNNDNNEREVMIRVSGIKKMYKLGQIGGGTLQADIQSWWARVRGKEDPNTKIGQTQRLVGQTFMALNGIDLTVYKGEALGIIGANGAGKSTLLKLLTRITAPTEGEIDLYGRVSSMLEVGTGFNGEMTGRENVYMNGAILGMTAAEIDEKMDRIIEFSEVRDFIDTPVKRYSSGMYVKLAFAVAAHLDSEIMIMDEVLAVGDVAFQKKCLNKMREAATQEGRTVLYVSHNMNTIRQLCDRCIVLDQGKVIFDGDVESAIEIYAGMYVKPSAHYEYTPAHHRSKFSSENFVIEGLDLLNSEDGFYQVGDRVRLQIRYSALKAYSRMKFRFVFSTNNQTVGTMFSAGFIDFATGNHQNLYMELDSSHIMAGTYRVDIIAFQVNDFGNEQLVDGVYPGMYLEIDDNMDTNKEVVWLSRYWGYIRLQDIEWNMNANALNGD